MNDCIFNENNRRKDNASYTDTKLSLSNFHHFYERVLPTTCIHLLNEFSGCQTRPSLSPSKSPILPIIVCMNEPSVVMLIAFKAETDWQREKRKTRESLRTSLSLRMTSSLTSTSLAYRWAGRSSLYRSDTNDYKWGSWATKGISWAGHCGL